MIEIRPILIQELTVLFPIGHAFYREGHIPGQFIESVFQKNWTKFLETGTGFIGAAFDDGKLIGCIGALVFNDSHDDARCAMEAFWFVFPEFRGKIGGQLLDYYEEECYRRGVERQALISLKDLNPGLMDAIYQKRGYRMVESIYIKENVCSGKTS